MMWVGGSARWTGRHARADLMKIGGKSPNSDNRGGHRAYGWAVGERIHLHFILMSSNHLMHVCRMAVVGPSGASCDLWERMQRKEEWWARRLLLGGSVCFGWSAWCYDVAPSPLQLTSRGGWQTDQTRAGSRKIPDHSGPRPAQARSAPLIDRWAGRSLLPLHPRATTRQ